MTVIVCVRLFPANTGLGDAVFVMERSADVVTAVVSVSVLCAASGSDTVELTVAVLLMVDPSATFASTLTTMVITCAPAATETEGLVHVTVPVLPSPGVVQDQPAGKLTLSNVVPIGVGSESVTLCALSGPL